MDLKDRNSPSERGQPDTAHLMQLLRVMHLVRCFDVAAGKQWEAGKIHGPVHPSVGQEAIAAGVCAHLRSSDYLSTSHRCHGHALAKGADPVRIMRELFGRAGGTCGGKGGSMHIADFSVGMIAANGIVADAPCRIALGAAQAAKLLEQKTGSWRRSSGTRCRQSRSFARSAQLGSGLSASRFSSCARTICSHPAQPRRKSPPGISSRAPPRVWDAG